MPARKNRYGGRRKYFAIGAIGLGLLPFIVVECLLRLTGLGVPSSYEDPFVGFSQIYPLFELDADVGEYRTARQHHYFFGPQNFTATKKPTTFRAFCLGGSTVLGHPYDTETAFSKWLEIELADRDPTRVYEIVNCGGMSYASYRLLPILEEVLSYQPDLIIVMTGHNEFLEDRTYAAIKQRSVARAWVEDRLFSLRVVTLGRRALDSLPGDAPAPAGKTLFDQKVDTRLDHASGYASYHRDVPWWAGVAHHFALNLRVMIRICRQAGVPILLVNPGSNVRDCPPFKSEHGSGLAAQQLARWEQHFADALELEVAHPAAALGLYKRAEEIDDRYAQLAYRIAGCLDSLGRYDEARDAYFRAQELDVCPLRMRDVLQQSLFEVAEQTATPVVDAAGLLEKRSRHGIVGFDWYVDQVHPSIRGHQLIAQALALQLHDQQMVPPWTQPGSRHDRRQAYRRHLDKLGDQYLAAGRRRVQWLERWARRDRLREVMLPLDARANLDVGLSYMDFAEYEQAMAAYRMAVQLDPTCAAQLMTQAFQLFQGGRGSAAERISRTALELATGDESVFDQAHIALTVLACENGLMGTARQHAKAVRSEPSSFDDAANAWLDELPEAKKLFD